MNSLPAREILGFIPARSGSKRVVDKNIRPLAGKSLIRRTIESALRCETLTELAFSSDSEEYVREACEAGLDVGEYRRPSRLATDSASTVDCMVHYLKWARQVKGRSYSHVVLLQVTSPFRTHSFIDGAVRSWADSGRSGLVSVRPVADSKAKVVVRDHTTGYLTNYQGAFDAADRKDLYVLTGAVYLTPVDMILEQNLLWNHAFALFVHHAPDVLDIDTERDFLAVETLLRSAEEFFLQDE